MAIAFVAARGSASSKSSASTLAITPSGTIAAGNFLRVDYCGSTSGSSISSVTDTQGNTYTVLADNAGSTSRTAIIGSILTTPLTASDTVTITLSAASGIRDATLNEYSGATLTEDVADVSAAGTSTTPSVGPSAATTNANDIVLGLFACSNATTAVTFTPGTGFTAGQSVTTGTTGSNRTLNTEHKIVAATGTQTADGTYNASFAWDATEVILKAAVTGITITVPSPAAGTMAALAPGVDKTVDAPIATMTMAALAPSADMTVSVTPPSAAAAMAALAPSLAFRAGTVWPPDGRFIFLLCDSDGDFVGELRQPVARSLTFQLNGVHSVSVTLSLDDDHAADVQPGLSRLKVYRLQTSGTRVLCFYGSLPAHAVKEDAAASTMSLTFMDPRWMLSYRYLHPSTDLLRLQPGEPVVGQIGLTIQAIILDTSTAITGGTIWINTAGPFPTTPSVSWPIDARNIYDQIDDITKSASGVDWDITPVDYFTSAGTRTMGDLEIYVTQGSDLPNVVFVYGTDLPSNVSNMTRAYTSPITYATVTGTDPDTSETLTATYGTPDDATYGALEVLESAPDIRSQAQLDDRAEGIVVPNVFPRQVIDIQSPLANGPNPFDDYYLGDTVYVTCRKGSMVFSDVPLRVHGFTIDIDQTGYETVSLTVADG